MSSAASAAVNKQLISLLFERFMILEHLRALKQFMLLGQVRCAGWWKCCYLGLLRACNSVDRLVMASFISQWGCHAGNCAACV